MFVFQHPRRGNVNPRLASAEIRSFSTNRLQHQRRGNVNPQLASTEVARKYFLLLGCGRLLILALSRKDELLQPLVFS